MQRNVVQTKLMSYKQNVVETNVVQTNVMQTQFKVVEIKIVQTNFLQTNMVQTKCRANNQMRWGCDVSRVGKHWLEWDSSSSNRIRDRNDEGRDPSIIHTLQAYFSPTFCSVRPTSVLQQHKPVPSIPNSSLPPLPSFPNLF